MARLNVEDHFWEEVADLYKKFPSKFEAVGQIIFFWKRAQERYKQGRVVTKDEFKLLGFSEHLVGSPFVQEVDGGYRAVGDSKHFHWLLKRVIAGQKGGSSKSEKKLAAALQNGSKKSISRKINNLEPKQTEANRSKPKQTEASSSSSSSSKQNPPKDIDPHPYVLPNLATPAEPPLPPPVEKFHWLAELWNECVKPPIRKAAPWKTDNRTNQIKKQLALRPSRDEWKKIFTMVQESDFLAGRGKWKKGATFDWILKPDNQQKVIEGNYINEESDSGNGTSATSKAFLERVRQEEEEEKRKEKKYVGNPI